MALCCSTYCKLCTVRLRFCLNVWRVSDALLSLLSALGATPLGPWTLTPVVFPWKSKSWTGTPRPVPKWKHGTWKWIHVVLKSEMHWSRTCWNQMTSIARSLPGMLATATAKCGACGNSITCTWRRQWMHAVSVCCNDECRWKPEALVKHEILRPYFPREILPRCHREYEELATVLLLVRRYLLCQTTAVSHWSKYHGHRFHSF